MHVTEVWRYPVKSLGGERVASAEVGEHGLVTDRGLGLLDVETGKVVSAKRPGRWAAALGLAAHVGADGVHITFPDGTDVPAFGPDTDRRLSDHLGRTVTVIDTPPVGAVYEEEWSGDLKGGAEPFAHLTEAAGAGDVGLLDAPNSPFVPSAFFDAGPVHLLTTGSLDTLARLAPGSRFDVRRFRPNLLVSGDDGGFAETSWTGAEVVVGQVVLEVLFSVPRCVATTVAQGDLPTDRDVLRTISANNMVEVLGTRYPCLGVYASVRRPGVVAEGDEVVVSLA